MKGGQLLEACTACFEWKVSCWTAGRGGRKKAPTKDHGGRKLEESSKSNKQGEESGWEWLTRFSILKVGPLKHAKPATKSKCLSFGEKLTVHRVMSRLAGLKAKNKLKRLCESYFKMDRSTMLMKMEVLANIVAQYNEVKSSIGVKWGANEVGTEPASKCLWVETQEGC